MRVDFDHFCQSCHDNNFLSLLASPTKAARDSSPALEVEFYCKSCLQAVCRNCLLQNHLNIDLPDFLDDASDSFNQEKLKEKQELLDQYERKTLQERMTVSLKDELQLKDEVEKGPNGERVVRKCHEIIDIKNDILTLLEELAQINKSLAVLSKYHTSLPRHSLSYE